MGSIPKASRWPVSSIVRPVFLDFHNSFVSHRPKFPSIYVDCEFKGNKGNKELNTRRAKEKTHRPATPMLVMNLCSRALGGGPIINDEGRLLEPVV